MCLLSLKYWSVPLPHNLQGGGSQFKNEAQVMHGSEMKMQICMCEVPDGLRLCNAGQKHSGGGGRQFKVVRYSSADLHLLSVHLGRKMGRMWLNFTTAAFQKRF